MKLTLTSAGLSQYATGIDITDAGANSSVAFKDSGGNSYANNFTVTLSNASAGAILFNGTSSFGVYSLQATTAKGIAVSTGAALTSSSGNLTLKADSLASPNGQGVVIDHATIASTGGQITVQGHGNNSVGNIYGVYLVHGGKIAGGTGTVSVTGTGGAANAAAGVFLRGSGGDMPMITSAGGDVRPT